MVRWLDRAEPFARAEVEFSGVAREVAMDCALEAEPGDYVVVHAGIAISRLDAAEATQLLAELRQLSGELPWADEAGAGELTP